MATITQKHRQLAIETPSLGEDVLLLTSFSGREQISRLFSYDLEMLSTRDYIPAKDIVGKEVTFKVRLADGEKFQYFHGFVSRFSAGSRESGFRRYQAQVVPWLWFLTRTADCRIFQEKTVPQIIEQIFRDLKFSDYESKINAEHKPLEYCVQYRETDFDFVSRLMEQEGIFYYFRHENGKHTLVLADHKGAYTDCAEKEVEYAYSHISQAPADRLTSWEHQYEYTPGKWAQTDYNFIDHPARNERTPSKLLMTNEQSIVKLDKIEKYEMYDYPGEYSDRERGETYTRIRMEEDEVPHDVVNAASTCKTFFPGGKFTLIKHDCQLEEGKTYVITSIEHSATEPAEYTGGEGVAEDYSNTFTCIPASVTFRPKRTAPKPVIQGSQTAVVTGPEGEEIYTDQYGRVNVQFFWDREAIRDENTSCFVRCAQPSAGKGWGSMFIPRVGQEVLVSYLEGDPDRPLITGLVYNADQMPAYTLPEEKTKSYIKTNSSPGGDGFNELRFEDKKGKEQVFIHAQRDMDTRVRNESRERIYGNRHQIIGWEKDGRKGGDQREMVYQDKHLTVHRNHIEHIGGDMTLKVGGIDGEGNQNILISKDRTEWINGNSTLRVGENRREWVNGCQKLQVDFDRHTKVEYGDYLQALYFSLTTRYAYIEAKDRLELKVGEQFITIGKEGIAISGNPVLINSGGSARGSSSPAPIGPIDICYEEPVEPEMADNSKTGQKSAPDWPP